MVKPTEASAGNIVLWDIEKKEKTIVEQEEYGTESFHSTRYIPIGVVAIPASHMPDGKTRMMSTRWMYTVKPKSGTDFPQFMQLGEYGEVSGLSGFSEIPTIQSAENQIIEDKDEKAFLPSNSSEFSGISNPSDSGTKWSRKKWCEIAPSPYASDGTPNPLYRATEYSGGTINNPLSDFDGRGNTDKILKARGERDYGTWKPSQYVPEDFPAASVCDMYYTVGTKQGDWYLPSCGELGYVVARLEDIDNAFRKIGGTGRLKYGFAWTSTVYNTKKAFFVVFETGQVVWNLKNLGADVIAFSILD